MQSSSKRGAVRKRLNLAMALAIAMVKSLVARKIVVRRRLIELKNLLLVGSQTALQIVLLVLTVVIRRERKNKRPQNLLVATLIQTRLIRKIRTEKNHQRIAPTLGEPRINNSLGIIIWLVSESDY